MALLPHHWVKQSELGTTYKHWGTIHGWVPVYIGINKDDGRVRVAVRNGWPDWLEDLGRWAYLLGEFVTELCFPQYESPGFCIRVKGDVVRDVVR